MPTGIHEQTCEEKYADEIKRACELHECASPGDANFAGQNFFDPQWVTEPGQFGKQVLEYLMLREPKPQFRGNNAEVICGCDGDNTGCCGCSESETGCDDPDQCHTFVMGFNYVALAKIAEHAQTLAYLPVAFTTAELLEAPEGTTLVWAPDAGPVNEQCDPCQPQAGDGAFVLEAPAPPVDPKEDILGKLALVMEDPECAKPFALQVTGVIMSDPECAKAFATSIIETILDDGECQKALQQALLPTLIECLCLSPDNDGPRVDLASIIWGTISETYQSGETLIEEG